MITRTCEFTFLNVRNLLITIPFPLPDLDSQSMDEISKASLRRHVEMKHGKREGNALRGKISRRVYELMTTHHNETDEIIGFVLL